MSTEKSAALRVMTRKALSAMVNNSGDSDVAINNAAPVKVIKAACSNHAMPVIHAPPAQGTNSKSARSTYSRTPIIIFPLLLVLVLMVVVLMTGCCFCCQDQ